LPNKIMSTEQFDLY